MFLKIKGSQLFYSKHGTGNKSLLLFHGFGQDHLSFKKITESISQEYTCYVFDLYFHGSSFWANDEKPLEKNEWRETIDSFIHENSITNFSLLGYSLGGKFVMATVEAFPEKVKEIFLIAPDGVKINFWYRMATYPFVMRRIFKSMIDNYKRFEGIARVFHTLGLVNKTVLRFAENQMDTEEKRKRVYYSWVVFRHLSFNMKTLAAIIRRKQIQLIVIVGKYDKIIKPGHMIKLLRHLEDYQFEIMDAGHNQLLEKSSLYLKQVHSK